MDYQELDGLADPMKKEVSVVRKRIDSVNKELKPLGQTCQKKVIMSWMDEYADFLVSFNVNTSACELDQFVSKYLDCGTVICYCRRGSTKKL